MAETDLSWGLWNLNLISRKEARMANRLQRCPDSEICHLCELVLDRRHPKKRRNEQLRPTADHVQPKSLGGPAHRDNLLMAHLFCNNRRANRPITPELKESLRTEILKRFGFLVADLDRERRKKEWWAA
jgi:hypothetical protein